jgi:DoxX
VLLSFVTVPALPPIARFKNQRGCAMANSQAKLMYPGLAGFYESMLPIAETFVRIVIGVMFVMHVSGKLTAGPAAVAANVIAKNGLEPAVLWAYLIIFLELVGGICLIIGLFTRFFCGSTRYRDADSFANMCC